MLYIRRIGAVAVDVLCSAFPLLVTSPISVMFMLSGTPDGQLTGLAVLKVNLLLSIVLYVFGRFYYDVRSAASPGQRVFKLKLISNAKDREVLLWQAAARSLVMATFLFAILATALYPLLLAPALIILTTNKALSPSDIVSQTAVEYLK